MPLAYSILALFTALALPSCSLVPAKLERISGVGLPKSESRISSLLEAALGEDNSSKLALAHFVEAWKKRGQGSTGEVFIEGESEPWTIQFRNHSREDFDFDYFDKLFPADDFAVKKIPHYKRAGLGAPLVGLRENRQSEAIEKFYPPEGITRPLTAYLEKTGARSVSIQLVCPLLRERTPGANSRALAADYSVSWAALLERTGSQWGTGVTDLLTRRSTRPPQLYLMEAYDPNKQPLIMIHGLLSTPLTWAKLSNELWADDDLRHRYQIWHFQYNTSGPALYATRQLRNQIKELRTLLDPKGHHHASQHTTLLTHSMGGLVGKALVVEPKDAFWEAAFTVPPAELKLSDEDRKTLANAFDWKSEKTIGRIIFCNVPHRGSRYADSFIGTIGRFIAAPPQSFQAFYQRISRDNPNVFTPAYRELGEGKLDSVSSLSPKQPTLAILNELPPAHPVIYHSIIGDRGRRGSLERSSDGVVTWQSSHFARAVSEKVVPSGHVVFHLPDAIAEIKRILKLPNGHQQ